MTDAEAIRRSVREPEVFKIVFQRHFAAVHRYARRRVGPDVADEVAAETFVRAFDSRRRYDVGRPDAKPWLLGIATNLLLRHWDGERKRLSGRPSVLARDCVPDPADADLGPEVIAALDALAPHDREALLLLAWADLSYDEIAVAQEVPIGTVRSRLARGRRRLREQLALSDIVQPGEGGLRV